MDDASAAIRPATEPPGSSNVAAPRPRHRGLAAFAAVVALSAWGGAAGLIVGFLSITPRLEARLPFASPVVGGIALASIVAVPMTVTAVLAFRGDPRTGDAALAAGLLQVGWIVVQVLFIRELSFFHPTYLVVGAVLAAIGQRLRSRAKMAP